MPMSHETAALHWQCAGRSTSMVRVRCCTGTGVCPFTTMVVRGRTPGRVLGALSTPAFAAPVELAEGAPAAGLAGDVAPADVPELGAPLDLALAPPAGPEAAPPGPGAAGLCPEPGSPARFWFEVAVNTVSSVPVIRARIRQQASSGRTMPPL